MVSVEPVDFNGYFSTFLEKARSIVTTPEKPNMYHLRKTLMASPEMKNTRIDFTPASELDSNTEDKNFDSFNEAKNETYKNSDYKQSRFFKPKHIDNKRLPTKYSLKNEQKSTKTYPWANEPDDSSIILEQFPFVSPKKISQPEIQRQTFWDGQSPTRGELNFKRFRQAKNTWISEKDKSCISNAQEENVPLHMVSLSKHFQAYLNISKVAKNENSKNSVSQIDSNSLNTPRSITFEPLCDYRYETPAASPEYTEYEKNKSNQKSNTEEKKIKSPSQIWFESQTDNEIINNKNLQFKKLSEYNKEENQSPVSNVSNNQYLNQPICHNNEFKNQNSFTLESNNINIDRMTPGVKNNQVYLEIQPNDNNNIINKACSFDSNIINKVKEQDNIIRYKNNIDNPNKIIEEQLIDSVTDKNQYILYGENSLEINDNIIPSPENKFFCLHKSNDIIKNNSISHNESLYRKISAKDKYLSPISNDFTRKSSSNNKNKSSLTSCSFSNKQSSFDFGIPKLDSYLLSPSHEMILSNIQINLNKEVDEQSIDFSKPSHKAAVWPWNNSSSIYSHDDNIIILDDIDLPPFKGKIPSNSKNEIKIDETIESVTSIKTTISTSVDLNTCHVISDLIYKKLDLSENIIFPSWYSSLPPEMPLDDYSY